MKKVLALVLALTMVLGFAATASAEFTYDGTYFKYNLFKNVPGNGAYEVGDFTYEPDMYVEGNKEYEITLTFDTDDLNDVFISDARCCQFAGR